jgi:branched-chain amino acid transport system permease protein
MTSLKSAKTGGILALCVVIVLLPLFLDNAFQYEIAILIGLNRMY